MSGGIWTGHDRSKRTIWSKLVEILAINIIQGDFFNWPSPENVSRLAPPKFAWTGPPPNFSKCWNHIHFARHLGVFRSEGGPVWDSNVFLKSVTYRPTLSKFRGGPVKKNTLYLRWEQIPNIAPECDHNFWALNHPLVVNVTILSNTFDKYLHWFALWHEVSRGCVLST